MGLSIVSPPERGIPFSVAFGNGKVKLTGGDAEEPLGGCDTEGDGDGETAVDGGEEALSGADVGAGTGTVGAVGGDGEDR